MKTLLLCVLVLFSLFMTSETPKTYQNPLFQRELASLTERGLAYRWLSNDKLEATDPLSGRKWVFNTESLLSPHKPTYDTIPTLTVDLRTIDTSLYNWKFHYVNTIPLTGGWGFPLEVSDFDNNGRPEAYGLQQTQSEFSTCVYELAHGSNWSVRYVYPGRYGTIDKSGDVDGNGLREVYARYGDSIFAFEQSAVDSIPTRSKFHHMQWYGNAAGIPNQVDRMTGNLLPEIVYRGAEPVTSDEGTYVVCFDSTLNSLRRRWSVQLPPGCQASGCTGNIATGDFDGDGKKEFVTSNFAGNVYVVEHVVGDSFAVTWSTTLSVAGRATTGDVDGNGITEFFVGGTQLESDGYVHLRGYAFERLRDNTFQPVFHFNIFPTGIFFVDLYQTSDVDGDDIPEFLISTAGGIVIIKGMDEHSYELFYYQPPFALDGVAAWKINNNRMAHLFVSRSIGSQQVISRTDVYSLDSTLVVNTALQDEMPGQTKLLSTYPNPFNSETHIFYELPRKGYVALTVYDLTGKEVIRLIEEVKEAGRHSTRWKAGPISSGVYLLRFEFEQQSRTNKVVYLK